MFPSKISLSYLNTPITKLESISKVLNKNIFIKHDEMTGMELSGNKIRKLEYSLKEAVDFGANVIITCGAIQSNHARATVVASRKLGLDVHLVLRGEEPEQYLGNLLINKIMGAKISFLDNQSFLKHQEYMNSLKSQYELSGKKAYIIPIGASNGIGNFGYYNAYQEILKQEEEMNIEFDTIVCTVGSAGTYSGLYLGNHFNGYKKNIIGYSVGGSSSYFKERSIEILNESFSIIENNGSQSFVLEDHFIINDKYQGDGYAQTSTEDIKFIEHIAQTEGIIFDPVYTGKAFKGLYSQIEKNELQDSTNILFIHTGGFFGIESFEKWFR